MKRLDSAISDQYELEVMECDCGFQLGIDCTYLLQVGDLKINCPSCGKEIDTAIIFPENNLTEGWAIFSQGESDSEGENMYWSNELGWTTLIGATFFTEEEKNKFKVIPMGGEWHEIKTKGEQG